MDNIQGNLSTIFVAIYAVLAPYIAQYVSQEVFVAICGLILVIWSAYNPNTFKIFGNQISTPPELQEIITEDDNNDDDGC